MPHRPFRHMIGTTLLVLLAACTSASIPVASPSPSASATAVQQHAAPAPLPLVELNAASPQPVKGLRMRPLDPATLADVPGIAPLDLAHHYVQTVSPDGRTMAAILWPSGSSNRGGVLHLIDLTSWVDTATAVSFDDYVAGLVFSPDGQSLYWAGSTRHDAAHGIGQDYALYRYDLAHSGLHEVTRFPTSFMPGSLVTSARFLHSGARLAIYGIPTDPDNLAEDVPHLLIVDLASERLAADLRLNGVKAGQFRESGPLYAMFSPGLAWDLARERLYIAHADVDAFTVVDLAGGTVLRQTAVQSHTSVIGRIAGWLMPSVAAKGGPTTNRWATLSTDGMRLFVIGQQSIPTQSTNSQWQISTTPTGLQVIDTETLHEVRRLDLPADAMMLSPDGRQLLLDTFRDDRADRTHTLVILDAERLTELGRSDFDAAFMLDGFSRDGRYVYLHQTANVGGDHVTVRVFDLQARRVVVERALDGYFAEVLAPRSDPTH